jgi:hypothetical protein
MSATPSDPKLKRSNQKNTIHLHSLIAESSYNDLKNLALRYGSMARVIEEALTLLKIRDNDLNLINKTELEPFQLWHLMRSDFNMMAVGRRTFLSYIETLPEEPKNENNALELVEWYYNKTITELSLYEILNAIRAIWIAGNYFRTIIIEPIDNPVPIVSLKFRMIFNHDFNERKYGQYWGEYFKTVLEKSPLNYKILKLEVRNQFFRLEVAK